MAKQETDFSALAQFIPPGTYELIVPYLKSYTIHLTLTHERRSVMGDYRNATREKPYHRISINATLNQYSFLITLLHELAHLTTFVQYRHNVAPHGKEWKEHFRNIMIPFLGQGFFPEEVEDALIAYIHNPAASTCTDPKLYKALRFYDEKKPGQKLVDELKPNEHFVTHDGRIFVRLEQLRTRTKGRELKTGRIYFFPGIMEVRSLEEELPIDNS